MRGVAADSSPAAALPAPLARLRSMAPPGPVEGPLGDHQNPTVILRRALERGNLVVAEITARELGRIDLADALELTALVAVKNRARSRRMAARWLERWLAEAAPSIDEAVMIAGCLVLIRKYAQQTRMNTRHKR
jgi:hypothetical protein